MKLLRKIEVLIRYVVWCIQRLKAPTTYDKVYYNGGYHYIKYGNPNWTIKGKPEQLKTSEFKVCRGIKRDWRVFKQRFRFQMSNWYSIDNRTALFTRISYKDWNDIFFGRIIRT